MLKRITIYSCAMNAEEDWIAELAGNDLIKEFLTLFAASCTRATIGTPIRFLTWIGHDLGIQNGS